MEGDKDTRSTWRNKNLADDIAIILDKRGWRKIIEQRKSIFAKRMSEEETKRYWKKKETRSEKKIAEGMYEKKSWIRNLKLGVEINSE